MTTYDSWRRRFVTVLSVTLAAATLFVSAVVGFVVPGSFLPVLSTLSALALLGGFAGVVVFDRKRRGGVSDHH